jgi:hypothetical protein
MTLCDILRCVHLCLRVMHDRDRDRGRDRAPADDELAGMQPVPWCMAWVFTAIGLLLDVVVGGGGKSSFDLILVTACLCASPRFLCFAWTIPYHSHRF